MNKCNTIYSSDLLSGQEYRNGEHREPLSTTVHKELLLSFDD